MEQFGVSQKQLMEEFTGRRLMEISEYNKIRNQIEKEEEQKAKQRSR